MKSQRVEVNILEINSLKKCFNSGTITEKIHTLSHLSDVFDSYKKNINNFEGIMNLLIICSITEDNMEVKREIFDTLVRASVFQDVHSINFDKLEDNLDELPIECLGRCIDIFSFTHKIKYIPSIERYIKHDDKYVRESAEMAINEIIGYHKRTIINKNGNEFIECISLDEPELINYGPVAGSYAVGRFDGKYLICFNKWRKQWEIPAGGRDDSETAKECAIRELFEETGQIVQNMDFKGLLKIRKPDGTIKYTPIFFAELDCIVPFKANEETDRILLWNLTEVVGYIDEVDEAVLKWCKSLS